MKGLLNFFRDFIHLPGGRRDTLYMELGLEKNSIVLFLTNRGRKTIYGRSIQAVLPGGTVCPASSDLKVGTEFKPNEVVICRLNRRVLQEQKCVGLSLIDMENEYWLIPYLDLYAEALGWDTTGNFPNLK